MIRRMGDYFSRWAEKYMPDPFLFAVLLTFLTLILGVVFTKSGPFDMLKHWNKGFWTLLAFSMQMYNGPHKLDRGLRLRSLPWRCRTPGG